MPTATAVPASRIPARTAEAATESGANDVSRIEVGPPDDARARTFAGDPAIGWSFALSAGDPAGQFAAVPIPVSPGLEAFDARQFRVSSPQPIRAWVQLRAPVGNTERWGATFYADSEVRDDHDSVRDVPADRRDVERPAAARPGAVPALRRGYAEHAARFTWQRGPDAFVNQDLRDGRVS